MLSQELQVPELLQMTHARAQGSLSAFSLLDGEAASGVRALELLTFQGLELGFSRNCSQRT